MRRARVQLPSLMNFYLTNSFYYGSHKQSTHTYINPNEIMLSLIIWTRKISSFHQYNIDFDFFQSILFFKTILKRRSYIGLKSCTGMPADGEAKKYISIPALDLLPLIHIIIIILYQSTHFSSQWKIILLQLNDLFVKIEAPILVVLFFLQRWRRVFDGGGIPTHSIPITSCSLIFLTCFIFVGLCLAMFSLLQQ